MLASVDASRATPEYVYQYLRSAAGQHALLANVSQTGVPAIARPTTSLRAIRVLAPPLSVQEAFARFAGTAMGCLDAQLWESRGLASIRAKLVERLFSPSPSTLSDVRARTA
jgi:type I restriction enzyme S subunit